MVATVIELDGVGKRYRLGEHHGSGTDLRETLARLRPRLRGRVRPPVRELWSLRDVSLEVTEGHAFGVLGSNGAGKSTLLKVINGITTPTTGRCRTRGRIGSLLEVGTGFHAELTGLENTYLNGAILGMSRTEVRRRVDDIVTFAGLEKFMDTPVKRYSSGMYLRLGFAIAAHMEADILLVDEVLAVGDVEFQRRCLGKMNEVEKSGRTVVFVSHNMEALARLCSQAVWLERGELRASGATDGVIEQYLRSARERSAALSFEIDTTRPAQLVSAAIVDDQGHPVSALGPNASAYVELLVVVHTPVAGLNITWQVRTAGGVTLLDEGLSDADVPPLDKPGRYRLRSLLPPVLSPGSYHVNLWVGTAYDDFEWREAALELTVEGDDSARTRHIRLGTPWTVESLPDEPRS